jgi:hypothetical protein
MFNLSLSNFLAIQRKAATALGNIASLPRVFTEVIKTNRILGDRILLKQGMPGKDCRCRHRVYGHFY